MTEHVSSKPPNILIYSGSSDSHNKTFNTLKQTLLQVINLHSYAIYKLHEKHVNTHPWMDNTTLLVLGNNDSMSASVQKDFIKYLTGGGKILSLCSSFTCNVKKLPWDDKYCPFPASVEVKHPEFFQGEPQNLSALCEPFYFEGECSDIITDLSLLIIIIVCIVQCTCTCKGAFSCSLEKEYNQANSMHRTNCLATANI